MRALALVPASVSLLILPLAGATGHLVNAGVGSSSIAFGDNVAGGQGDTLDVGIQNEQCSDEGDVVDVGVLNKEGKVACDDGRPCHAEKGSPFLGPVLAPIDAPGPSQSDPHCSDDGDTVDVGVLNQEGPRGVYCEWYSCPHIESGDSRDAVDVGIGNSEWGDGDDGADVGALNCESRDERDALDVGVGNVETWDAEDVFDASLLSTEWNDGPNGNGFNVLSGQAPSAGCLGESPRYPDIPL